jgi:DNA-binding IclR family transcriptional regulator
MSIVRHPGKNVRKPRGKSVPRQDNLKLVSVVDRAARLMNCFTSDTQELDLQQMTALAGLPKPTTFRLLANMVRHGLLEYKHASGNYMLGFTSLLLAEALLQGLPLRVQARPFMEEIRDSLNETVVLSIKDHDHRINIESVESTQVITATLNLGVRIPLYAGAASQVLLAGMQADDIDAYLERTDLVSYNTTTLTTTKAVRARLAKVREQGYALTFAEFTPGGSAIAVPIMGPEGCPVGALHISGPKGRLNTDVQGRCVEALLRGSKALTEELCRPRP